MYVTLCVHGDIAAADAVCCARPGEHAHGQNPAEAVALLRKVDPKLARHLEILLGLKTKAGYSELPATASNRRQAERAAAALVKAVADLA